MGSNTSETAVETVLLVDDDEGILKNAALILSLEDYNVCVAQDGQTALEILTEQHLLPHLIVSDISMPRLDGYGLLKAVRAIPSLRTVPFIFLSAHGSKQHIRQGREMGVDDYLVKPFEPHDLLLAVRNRISRHKDYLEQASVNFNEVRQTLIQMLAHELRTPLTYITGGFDLLADYLRRDVIDPTNPDVSISIDLIRSGAARLTRMAEQVVRYMELTSGFARAQFDRLAQVVSLYEIVEQGAQLAERDIAERRIDLVKDYHIDGNPTLYAMPDTLAATVYEALRNACQYSPEESTVYLRVYTGSGQGIIEVRDHGHGISPEHLNRIWEVLTQSERQKYEQQGIGMGLPLVKQVMALHGGDVQIESAPGLGTTVWMRIPLRQAP